MLLVVRIPLVCVWGFGVALCKQNPDFIFNCLYLCPVRKKMKKETKKTGRKCMLLVSYDCICTGKGFRGKPC